MLPRNIDPIAAASRDWLRKSNIKRIQKEQAVHLLCSSVQSLLDVLEEAGESTLIADCRRDLANVRRLWEV